MVKKGVASFHRAPSHQKHLADSDLKCKADQVIDRGKTRRAKFSIVTDVVNLVQNNSTISKNKCLFLWLMGNMTT